MPRGLEDGIHALAPNSAFAWVAGEEPNCNYQNRDIYIYIYTYIYINVYSKESDLYRLW